MNYGLWAFLSLCVLCWMVVSVSRNVIRRNDREQAPEDARIAQDIHASLAKMEKRIEALETLLIERDRFERIDAGLRGDE